MSLANLFTENPKQYQSLNINSISVSKEIQSFNTPVPTEITITEPSGTIDFAFSGTLSQGQTQTIKFNYAPFDPSKNVVIVTNIGLNDDERKQICGISATASGSFTVYFRCIDPNESAELGSLILNYLVV